MVDMLQMPPHLVPQRKCAGCGAVHDTLHLTQIGPVWLCKPCHHQLHHAEIEKTLGQEPGRAPMSTAEAIRLADTTYQVAGMAVRVALYAVLYALSTQHDFVVYLMAGFFAGDAAALVLTAWFQFAFHRRVVVFDVVLLSVVAWVLQSTGAFDIPEDPASRALMGLAFMATITLKLARTGWTIINR